MTAHVQLHTSPHLRAAKSVDVIMRNVALALTPVCLFSVYQFGLSTLALILFTTGICVLTEHICCRLSAKPSTIGDWSAAVTGVLLALTLPPGFPLWMAAVAAIFAIAVGKVFFGGLGCNVMNPALVGRAFVQAAFTVPITTWTPAMVHVRFREFIPSTLTFPFARPPDLKPWLDSLSLDGFTGATPLALMKFDHITTRPIQLFLGTVAGSAGETSAGLILLCGAYLAIRGMMNWRIVAAVLGAAFTLSGALYLSNPAAYPDPFFTLTSGGLMLGAVFMATDMVASPVTPKGVWIYGALIGIITVVIRIFGGLNEGVMYAILLGNASSPLISRLTQPRRYGAPVKAGSKA
jgi:Na+-translocating ferredoxin:NAD+ oxidoreductase subunit D